MSRSLSDIYNEAVAKRNEYLNLNALDNDSKMSIINAITYTVSSVIFSFETLLDAFMVDLANIFGDRINGTPAYYVGALKKWQYGDDLVVDETGTKFQYASADPSKRLITRVAYEEHYNQEYKDDVLILKVAKGADNALERLSDEELRAARAYLGQIKFAGVKANVVSRRGDVLVPYITVYYDGAVPEDTVYTNIENALADFITNMSFNSNVYVQKLIDAIQGAEHVVDVYFDSSLPANDAFPEGQGFYLAQYDDNNQLGPLTKINRAVHTASGYLKQSTKADQEQNLLAYREAIILRVETTGTLVDE